MFASGSPREIVAEKNERGRETWGGFKGREGRSCSSCQTRVMDTSHCGKLTNTPWRPSDARVYGYAHPYARPSAISMLKSSHTYVHARAPTRDKHERVYVGSLLRKRNEMKRSLLPLRCWSSGIAPSPTASLRRFHSSSRAFPRACVADAAGSTNK